MSRSPISGSRIPCITSQDHVFQPNQRPRRPPFRHLPPKNAQSRHLTGRPLHARTACPNPRALAPRRLGLQAQRGTFRRTICGPVFTRASGPRGGTGASAAAGAAAAPLVRSTVSATGSAASSCQGLEGKGPGFRGNCWCFFQDDFWDDSVRVEFHFSSGSLVKFGCLILHTKATIKDVLFT